MEREIYKGLFAAVSEIVLKSDRYKVSIESEKPKLVEKEKSKLEEAIDDFYNFFPEMVLKRGISLDIQKNLTEINEFTWLVEDLNNLSLKEYLKPFKAEIIKISSLIENAIPKIETVENKKKTKQQINISYIWQSNPDKELPKLFKLMVENYKLIALDTTLEQFKAVFTGQPTNKIKPIKWHQDNASELLYFNEAIDTVKAGKVNSVGNRYQRMKACFIRPNGQPFDASFKELKQNLTTNLSQEKQDAIDELLKIF